MRKFRLLTPEEIECRVAMITEKGLQLLLYKTARTDYALLDETVGAENWQNDYKDVSGNVYCGIGILTANGWIWKWNCGTESNMEAEKGEASDAMKRAGFAWGIGTELYSSPWIWVKADACNIEKNDRGKLICNDKFKVVGIDYDENENISFLAIDNVKKHCAAFMTDPKRKSKPVQDAEIPPLPSADQLRKEILAIAPMKGKSVESVVRADYSGLTWNDLPAESLLEIKRRLLLRDDV